MKRLVLIDSNALVHRAFHALPPTLSSPKGVSTNAVYGFTSVLLKMLKDLKPDYLAATYDLAGPTFRHEEFAEYKIHREKAPDELYAQIPLTKEILTAFGIPIFQKQGFEADDLIGSLAEKAKNNPPTGGLQVVIVTGDLDTLQLVDGEKVVVFTLRKGLSDTITYDEKEVKNRYGLKPGQITDFKGLKGDPSDNIPGVPGIGDKTASSLMQTFHDMESLYKTISGFKLPISKEDKARIKPPLSERLVEKLVDNKDQAFFSKKLATIICDVDMSFSLDEADWRKNMNQQEIERLFKEFGFFSLVKRVRELDINISSSRSGSQQSLLDESEIDPSVKQFRILSKAEDLINATKKLAKSGEIILGADERILFLSDGADNGFGIDTQSFSSKKIDRTFNDILKEILENNKTIKIGHDLKPVFKVLYGAGINLKGKIFDTKIGAYLLRADQKDYELPIVYFTEFGENLSDDYGDKIKGIVRLKKSIETRLKNEKLNEVFENIEAPLIGVLARMEMAGIKINRDSLSKLSRAVNEELISLEKEIYSQAGANFNINSPQQLKEILFDRLSIKGKVRKTAKGALSTAASELEKLIDEHPIISSILKYRELQKLKTTYIEPFPQLINQNTGRLYTTFNQTGTVTGRLSSQDPNLQNIPVRTEVGQEFRKAFVSSPGYKLVSFDYSQLELRIVAHISGDKKMISAFKRGEDIHNRTAAEVFGVKPELVTKNMRRDAKALNFGLIYGMGVLGFQRASGFDREKAREFIDRYMAEFNGVSGYMNEMRFSAKKDGFVMTIFGRKRYLPEINSGMPQMISQAERMAINMPIQGTAADLLKMAMIKIERMISNGYGEEDIKMILQVHDELLFEIKNSLAADLTEKILNIMENVHKLEVPLVVDAKIGDNWRDMEAI